MGIPDQGDNLYEDAANTMEIDQNFIEIKKTERKAEIMFENVLVPTDLSEYSERTIECAARIPGVREMVLQHVVDATEPSRYGWILEREVENARLRLEEIKSGLEKSGKEVRIRVDIIHEGDVPGQILDVVKEQRIELIVLGARGKGIIRDIFLGSVAHAVLRHAPASVLVMRHRFIRDLEGDRFEKFCPDIFLKILCPTDFSGFSDSAISIALRIPGNAEIDLLHVVTKGETREDLDERVRKAGIILADKQSQLSSEGKKATVHVRVGDPAAEIERVAGELDSSLILMSPYGKGWFEEILYGSTTMEVARIAKCPLLVVKGRVI